MDIAAVHRELVVKYVPPLMNEGYAGRESQEFSNTSLRSRISSMVRVNADGERFWNSYGIKTPAELRAALEECRSELRSLGFDLDMSYKSRVTIKRVPIFKRDVRPQPVVVTPPDPARGIPYVGQQGNNWFLFTKTERQLLYGSHARFYQSIHVMDYDNGYLTIHIAEGYNTDVPWGSIMSAIGRRLQCELKQRKDDELGDWVFKPFSRPHATPLAKSGIMTVIADTYLAHGVDVDVWFTFVGGDWERGEEVLT